MPEHTIPTSTRVWYESPHASLCLLGRYLRHMGFFASLEAHIQIKQKTIKYTPVQKPEMLLVALRAGAKAVSHTDLTLRVDPVLASAFGLPGCAEQSVIAATLDAVTEVVVAALRVAIAELFRRYGQARRHDFAHDLLVLDVDLSPLPASAQSEGSERGYMGRCRSKTGRKLVRVRAAASEANHLGRGRLWPNGREPAGPAVRHPGHRAASGAGGSRQGDSSETSPDRDPPRQRLGQ